MHTVDDHARALLQLAGRLGTAVTKDQVCQAIIDQAAETLGAYAGGVLLKHRLGESLQICASFGYDRELIDQYELVRLTEKVPATEAFLSGENVFLHNAAEWNARYAPLNPASATRSAAALVLSTGAAPVGVLTLAFRTSMQFTARERVFATTLAVHCAQALERAELYEREREARAEAERAGRAKDDFMAVLSHELRTPVNAVLGWARLLRTNTLDPAAAQKGLESIERNARLQARLISDMLDMARIASGNLQLDLQETSLAPLIESVFDNTRPSADGKGVTLLSALDPDVGPVLADSDRLLQAVSNLVVNAVKFTPRSGTVVVTLDRLGGSARVTVTDTGDGIERDQLPHVFEAHHTSGDTRRGSGLGLGLAITRHIVERHGGTVSAQSDGPGQGARFTIRLPLIRRVAAADTMLAVDPATLPHLDGIRIVLVEDDTDSREVATRLLTATGARVDAFASARDAWTLLEREQPDVLIADIGLPDEDGYSLLRRVRALEGRRGWPVLPAIALTAFASADARRTAMLSGFNLHLAKPLEIQDLVANVRRLTATARAGHQPDRGRST